MGIGISHQLYSCPDCLGHFLLIQDVVMWVSIRQVSGANKSSTKVCTLAILLSVADLGGGGRGGNCPPPFFSSPPFSFLLVVCVVSVTVHTTPALHGVLHQNM